MLDEARPVVDALGPAARDLRRSAASLRPIADELFRHQPGVASHLENLLTATANWAMATSNYDGLSHYFAAVVVAAPNTAANAGAGALPAVLPDNTFNPVPEDPNNPDGDRGTQVLPGVPAVPRVEPLQEPGNTTPPTHIGDGGAGSATGLTPEQEESMIDELLGGAN
jgi:phospholipid/cholesterol/gamma-HCH transport system substrate-binding protein